MALNFRIVRHHNSDNLHLNLIGNFDGGSAMELVNIIEENAAHFKRIFVHTCGLTALLPFGESVFIRKLRVSRLRRHQLVFTGDYGPTFRSDVPDRATAGTEPCCPASEGFWHTA